VYEKIEDVEIKRSIGRVVGRINEKLGSKYTRLMMIGPGRWGSSNIDLGVNVSYSDIDNTAVLIEIAREEAGHTPEVSYGTHFFQDIVEEQTIYAPVYPDKAESMFNEAFFNEAENVLTELLPDEMKFESFVKVIDVPVSSGGAYAFMVADPENGAVCYLSRD
jgi:hypothetical protein